MNETGNHVDRVIKVKQLSARSFFPVSSGPSSIELTSGCIKGLIQIYLNLCPSWTPAAFNANSSERASSKENSSGKGSGRSSKCRGSRTVRFRRVHSGHTPVVAPVARYDPSFAGRQSFWRPLLAGPLLYCVSRVGILAADDDTCQHNRPLPRNSAR